MKKLIGGTVLAAFALLAVVATALATSPSGVTKNETLALGNVPDLNVKAKTGHWKVKIRTKGPSTVAVSELRIAPGGNVGWHSHPGPSFVIVKSGTLTFYDGDDPNCTPQRHEAGTAYVDPGGDTHIVRNEGAEELVLYVTRVLPQDAAPRIDEPSPGTCPF